MISEPKLVEHPQRHYAAIRTHLAIQELATVTPQLHIEVYVWLGKRGIATAGAAFIRYLVIDANSQVEVEIGIPVTKAVTGDTRVLAGVIPAGRYATLTYTGHYAGLPDANAALLAWGRENGIVWQKSVAEKNPQLAWSLEFYITDPATEPDPAKWVTEIAYLVPDDQLRQ